MEAYFERLREVVDRDLMRPWEVMKACEEGAKIEWKARGSDNLWRPTFWTSGPEHWNWEHFEYRVIKDG